MDNKYITEVLVLLTLCACTDHINCMVQYPHTVWTGYKSIAKGGSVIKSLYHCRVRVVLPFCVTVSFNNSWQLWHTGANNRNSDTWAYTVHLLPQSHIHVRVSQQLHLFPYITVPRIHLWHSNCGSMCNGPALSLPPPHTPLCIGRRSSEEVWGLGLGTRSIFTNTYEFRHPHSMQCLHFWKWALTSCLVFL